MPYKDIQKNRLWHKNHMRLKRNLLKLKLNSKVVTPSTSRDTDGNIIDED